MQKRGASWTKVTKGSDENAESAASNGLSGGSESDTSSEICPVDLINAMDLIRQLEEEENILCCW
ncbi:hypothetical protein JG687_00010375 [Phytophthora cactorum]|uniref:Uncharacterized protein n=1 Tax=Phytophthora cactorum TaxID=29920 RepID=A0A8T1UA52_9STRA|nr:hypothetical protein JG687_00010375 [Phytophthora cactorum]